MTSFTRYISHNYKLNIQKEYVIATSLDLGQLKQLLKDIVIYDHRLIFIRSATNTNALFKDGADYYYYSADCTTEEIKTLRHEAVVES